MTAQDNRTERPKSGEQARQALLNKGASASPRRYWLDLASLILALCLIELPALFNLIDYRSLTGSQNAAAADVSDPEVIHRHAPHWRTAGARNGGNIADGLKIPASDLTSYRWDVTYDRNGFRNERDLDRAGIAVLGDSLIESVVRPTAQLMTSLLGQFQHQVVANLGQYGYGPGEELGVLKRYALPLRPRTIIWTFYEGNDLGDLIHYHDFMNAQSAAPSTAAAAPPGLWAGFRDRSFAANVFRELKLLMHPAKKPGIGRSGIVRLPNGRETNMYFGYESAPLTDAQLKLLDETVSILRTASDLCASQQVRFVVVLVPEKFRVFQPICRFPKESVCGKWTLSDLPERLRRGLASASPKAGFLDLTPALSDAAAKGVLVFDRDDTHWSAEGEQVAARAIDEYLRTPRGTGSAGSR